MMQWLKDLFDDPRLGGKQRSPKWGETRKRHMVIHPDCAVCGKKGTLLAPNEAHHIIPFNVDPSKELSYENLITLCRKDHLLFGHLNHFRSWNPDVRNDAVKWNYKLTHRA